MLNGMPIPFRNYDIDSEHIGISMINPAFDADTVRQFKKNLILAVPFFAGETIPVNRAAIWEPVQVELTFKTWIAFHGTALLPT